MKKKNFITWIIVLGIIALIVLVPILANQNTIWNKISYSEMKEDLSNEEFTLIYIGQKSCEFCEQMQPYLVQLIEDYEIEIEYLDYSNLTSSEKTELKTLDDRLSTMGTPTFIFVKYGEVMGVKIGATENYEDLEEIFLSYYQDPVYYETIGASEFVEKFNEKDSNVLVISQTTCGYCADFKPILSRVTLENDLDTYVIEFDTLTSSEKEKIVSLDESLAQVATPLTLITKKGKVVDSLSGAATKADFEEFLKVNKIIE